MQLMNPRDMYFSNHWTKDRQERTEQINYVLHNDWGVVIYKAWDAERKNWQFITNTGLLFIMDELELFIVTMYIPTKSQFIRFFQMAGQIPSERLTKRAKHNNRKVREWRENFLEKVA